MRSLFGLAALPFAFSAPVEQAAEARGNYIVGLKPQAGIQTKFMAFRSSILQTVQPYQQYDVGSFRGFAASLTASQVEALQNEPQVDYIEEDGVMHTQLWSKRAPGVTQSNSTWGLARISHRELGAKEYSYDLSGGEGTCVYIIDTGLQTKHPEFEGRATLVEVLDKSDKTDLDMFGHGTHVAGTIGSKSYGVAKKAQLLGIKVCNALGLCDVSTVGKGIEVAIKDSKTRHCPNGAVINMSLGAPKEEWKSILKATEEAQAAGVFVSVSAGNAFVDSTAYLPASAPTVCTVGATDNADGMASFSNYGAPVKVFAPGVDVLSTYSFNGSIETQLMSGTSMASPHVAGLAAYLMGKDGKVAPEALCKKIQDLSTKNVVTSIPENSNTVNYLAFNGASA